MGYSIQLYIQFYRSVKLSAFFRRRKSSVRVRMSNKILSPSKNCKKILNDKIELSPPTAVGGGDREGLRLVLPETSLPAAKLLGRGMGCVWTLFDYEAYVDELKKYAKEECSYAVWGYEICPETDRAHLQGYVHWKNPRSLGAFSAKFGNCHVEKPKGTAKQNRAYCLKIRPGDTPNKFWEEYGELPEQGKRKDWDEVVSEIQKGTAVQDIIEGCPQLIPYQRHIREVKQLFMKPRNRDVEVIVLYGKGGTGKTRWAYDNYPELYKKPSGEWWNNYEGEKTVLLDDFYGWIKYHDLLTILDRYAVNLPIKGGYVWAQYDRVIITSNVHPRNWFKNQWTWPLRRRLKKIILVESIDGETHFTEEDFPSGEEAWRVSETQNGS